MYLNIPVACCSVKSLKNFAKTALIKNTAELA